MAFCEKCGAEINEGAKFCPKCGAGKEETPKAEAPEAAKPVANEDVKANRGAAIVSYIFPLTFITMFATKGSKFARFHLDQSLFCYLVFLIGDILLELAGHFIYYVFALISFNVAKVFSVIFYVFSWLWLAFIAVLLIMGLIFAAAGKTKEIFLYSAFRGLKAKLAAMKDDQSGVPVSESMKERVICALAYLPPLFFLPLIYFGKENKFARFHVNQAFIFNIAVITSAGIIALLTSIQEVMALADAVSAVVYFIFSAFFAVVVYALLFAACMLIVLGFMNAGFGRTKAVGFLKKIKIFK